MKISQRQAQLLAKEIVNQLKAKKVQKVPEPVKEQLKQFLEKRRQLVNEKADVQEKINRHDGTLPKIIGGARGIHASSTFSQMIERMEEKNIPTTQQIEDEILLKSMFKSEEDMETFVNSIVKKYEKRLQNKVLSN